MEAIIESAKGSLEALLRLPILLLIPLAMIILGIVLLLVFGTPVTRQKPRACASKEIRYCGQNDPWKLK